MGNIKSKQRSRNSESVCYHNGRSDGVFVLPPPPPYSDAKSSVDVSASARYPHGFLVTKGFHRERDHHHRQLRKNERMLNNSHMTSEEVHQNQLNKRLDEQFVRQQISEELRKYRRKEKSPERMRPRSAYFKSNHNEPYRPDVHGQIFQKAKESSLSQPNLAREDPPFKPVNIRETRQGSNFPPLRRHHSMLETGVQCTLVDRMHRRYCAPTARDAMTQASSSTFPFDLSHSETLPSQRPEPVRPIVRAQSMNEPIYAQVGRRPITSVVRDSPQVPKEEPIYAKIRRRPASNNEDKIRKATSPTSQSQVWMRRQMPEMHSLYRVDENQNEEGDTESMDIENKITKQFAFLNCEVTSESDWTPERDLKQRHTIYQTPKRIGRPAYFRGMHNGALKNLSQSTDNIRNDDTNKAASDPMKNRVVRSQSFNIRRITDTDTDTGGYGRRYLAKISGEKDLLVINRKQLQEFETKGILVEAEPAPNIVSSGEKNARIRTLNPESDALSEENLSNKSSERKKRKKQSRKRREARRRKRELPAPPIAWSQNPIHLPKRSQSFQEICNRGPYAASVYVSSSSETEDNQKVNPIYSSGEEKPERQQKNENQFSSQRREIGFGHDSGFNEMDANTSPPSGCSLDDLPIRPGWGARYRRAQMHGSGSKYISVI